MNFYERHIGDYLKDTSHLSLLEHGIYTRLLDIYYTREAGIPEKEAARLIGARTKDEREALACVLAEFFTLADGVFTQGRAEQEIERLRDKRRKASASASASWEHRRAQSERNANASETHMRTDSERNANAMRTQCDGNARAPVPSPQSPVPSLAPEVQTAGAAVSPPAASARAPTPPPAPFRGEADLERLNGRHVVALADDWELPAAWGLDAEALGWKPPDVLRESERFRQYWAAGKGQGKRRSVKGWRQSWSNWLAKAEGMKR